MDCGVKTVDSIIYVVRYFLTASRELIQNIINKIIIIISICRQMSFSIKCLEVSYLKTKEHTMVTNRKSVLEELKAIYIRQ